MRVRAAAGAYPWILFLTVLVWCTPFTRLVAANEPWVSAWTTASIPVDAREDATPLAGASLRQVVRVSAAGASVRLRVGNHFGAEPLELAGARIALAGADGSILEGSSKVVRFGASEQASVAPGAALVSDPVEIDVTAGTDLAISLSLKRVPARLTAHPGSRATSYLVEGDALDAVTLSSARRIPRWYFIDGLEVQSRAAAAVAILGDSITDGYGCAPDSNTRWPDFLVRRLQKEMGPNACTVLNLGIGGNRVLRDGLGPNALARLNRDVLVQPGVQTLILFIGINDIGTRVDARKKEKPYASAEDIIAGLQQLVLRARAHRFKVIGGTITPYRGADFYWTDDGEADRQVVNTWIRESGTFDAVIDFDAALRDPAEPARLLRLYDSGDHLHPSTAGYEALANAVPLDALKPTNGGGR